MIKLPTNFCLTDSNLDSDTSSRFIEVISLMISVTALSVTSFLTLVEAVKVLTYLLVEAEEYAPYVKPLSSLKFSYNLPP